MPSCGSLAERRGARVFAVDMVPERLAMASRHGITTVDRSGCDDLVGYFQEQTGGRGPDAVIDAVGMEAHGSPVTMAAQKVTGVLPARVSEPLLRKVGVDRLAALLDAIAIVRRGGNLSLSGVCGGIVDPLPMLTMFDKGITIRMGQAHVRRWIDDLLPLVMDDADPLGTADLVTHTLPLREAPHAYEIFQEKNDGARGNHRSHMPHRPAAPRGHSSSRGHEFTPSQQSVCPWRGSGEYLNEHILGDHWPPAERRQEMLEEAIGVMRRGFLQFWRDELRPALEP